MCLAVPGKVIDVFREHDLRMGQVDFGGVSRSVCLEHVPDAAIGEYVLVHVGFALARVDEREAEQIFAFLREMDELDEVRGPPA